MVMDNIMYKNIYYDINIFTKLKDREHIEAVVEYTTGALQKIYLTKASLKVMLFRFNNIGKVATVEFFDEYDELIIQAEWG